MNGGDGEGGKLRLFSAKLRLFTANSETYTQFPWAVKFFVFFREFCNQNVKAYKIIDTILSHPWLKLLAILLLGSHVLIKVYDRQLLCKLIEKNSQLISVSPAKLQLDLYMMITQ